jgi:hypothetical protein
MPGQPNIEARLKDLLDETRLVMLGTQLLLGLQYRAAFADAFEWLPPPLTALNAVALILILAAAVLLLAVPALHQIAEKGHATGFVIDRGSLYLRAALLPLACTLGLDIAIGLGRTIGVPGAVASGMTFVLLALGAWYAIPALAAEGSREDTMEDKEQSLETRIIQALTELRVILPGAQALFGFQFSIVLTRGFDTLPPLTKGVHLASLMAVAGAITLLIAPAAYHRIAAKGKAEQRVLTYSTMMILSALGLLAFGMAGAAYVTVQKIFEWPILAGGIAAAVLVAFAFMLYALPLYRRAQRDRSARLSVGVGTGAIAGRR